MLYCGTLWWTPRETQLLRVKLDEGEPVDQWILSQATTTFRGNPRCLCYPEVAPRDEDRIRHEVVDTAHVIGRERYHDSHRNALQRNATLPAGLLRDDDVFVFCDLDEIVHRDDWSPIVDGAATHGLVYLSMRNYYGKINLQAPNRWAAAFAVSGRYVRDHAQDGVETLRRRHASTPRQTLKIQGQHFGWLYPNCDSSGLSTKIMNNVRTRHMRSRLASVTQQRTPSGVALGKVPIDGTYPRAIREDLDAWKEYMA